VGQKVRVASQAILLASPQFKQKCTLQDEDLAIDGAAKSEENPFEAIFDQDHAEIGVELPGDIAQFLADGSRDVFWRRIRRLE